MGECGCGSINWRRKIIGSDGAAYLLGCYPSCHYCSGPVAFNIFRVEPKDWHLWDVESIADLTVDEYGGASFALVDPQDVRSRLERVLTGHRPESGVVDQIDAELISEEAFSDLRDVVKVDIWPK